MATSLENPARRTMVKAQKTSYGDICKWIYGEEMISFGVIDVKTGKYPDLEKIVLNEEWEKHLMYCDMEGFHIDEDGTLCLADECGNYAYCPHERFKIIVEIPDMKTNYSFVY